MKSFIKKWGLLAGASLLASLILVAAGQSAIQAIYGLAVANGTQWFNLKDVSSGDNATSGAMLVSPCVWDGSNCDRARGDTTNGLDVDITRVGGNVTVIGATTPADNAANGTTAINTFSYTALFDGTTWDRALASTHADNITTAAGMNTASIMYGFDGTNYDRIRAGANNADAEAAVTAGLVEADVYLRGFNGTTWDRLKSDTTNGLDVDVTRAAGAFTPADGAANPTTAIPSESFLMGWNETTWDRVQTGGINADGHGQETLGHLETIGFPYVFNGSTWDRVRSGVITGAVLTDGTSNASSNIAANATTAVKATGGVLNSIIVNTGGTTSTVSLYNIASAGCTGTPASGFIGTLATTASATQIPFNHTFTLGICTVTAGAAAANISALYR